MTADDETIRARAAASPDTFRPGARDASVGCFAADAWIEDPVGTPRRSGVQAIGAFFDESRGLADSIELRRTGSVRVAGGEAAFPMQARPTIGGAVFVVEIIDV